MKYPILSNEIIKSYDLENRKIIFLDTFVWQKLILKNEDKYKSLYSALIKGTETNKIHICIPNTLIWEICIREDENQKKAILELMEYLSSRIYLKNQSKLFENEFYLNLRNQHYEQLQPIPRDINSAYGSLIESAGNFFIESTEWIENLPEDERKNILGILNKNIINLSIQDFDLINQYTQAGRGFKHSIQNSINSSKLSNLEKIKDYIANEFTHSKKNYLKEMLASCEKLNAELSKNKEIINITPSKFDQAIYNCPSLKCSIILNANIRFRHEKEQRIKPNHSYDVLNLSLAIPYSDLILADKEMIDICKKETEFSEFQVKYFTESEISKLIEEIK